MNRPRPPPAPPARPKEEDLPPPEEDDDDLPPPDDDLPPDDDMDDMDEPPPPEDDDGPPMEDDDDIAPPPPEEEDDDMPPIPEDESDGPPMDADDMDAPEDDMDMDDLPEDEPIDDEEEPPMDGEPSFDELDAEPPMDDPDEESMPPLPEEDDMPSDPEDGPDDGPPLDLDGPDEEDDDLPPPPASGSRSTFVLPVRKTGSVAAEADPSEVNARAGPAVDLRALTAGLAVKEPPQLMRRSVANNGPVDSANSYPLRKSSLAAPKSGYADVTMTDLTAASMSDAASLVSVELSSEEVRQKAIQEGFEAAMGKFDVDPFEALYVKVERETKCLFVMVSTGAELAFDLTQKAFVFEDTAEPCTIVLDYHSNIIVFKFDSTETLISFMKNMPEEVFMAPDAEAEAEAAAVAKKEKDEAEKKAASKKGPAPRTPKVTIGPRIEHVKGTSVEDILENDFELSADRQGKIDAMFSVKETITMYYPPAPLRRKELVESHIRKPKYSVRRVTLLCEWINSLHIWINNVTIMSFHKEMCNGLLLAKVVKVLNPEVQFVHLNEKPLAKKAAIDNLDQALGHIWRSKSLNNSRIPSAADIYAGKTSKTAVLINELFNVYIARPLYKNAMKMLKWYNAVLKQYNRPLPGYVFEEGDLSAVWPHFQSGTALFCMLYHLFGPTLLGKGRTAQRIDPLRVCGDPSSICEYRDNIVYAFSLLEALHIDILWTVEDWISFPDTEFIMLQLSFIYEKLKTKQCSLPPAQGNTPGITSGLHGELMVVGLVFKDAPLNSKFLPKTHKAVLLGYDRDSMPLLPIDKQIKNPRYHAEGILPPGMTHNQARIESISLDLKESRIHADKGDWNARTKVHVDKDTFVGSHLVQLLREHHYQADMLEATGGAAAGSEALSVSSNPSTRGAGHLSQLQLQTSTRRASALSKQLQQQTIGALTGMVRETSPTSPAQLDNNNINKEIDALVAALDLEMTTAHNQLNLSEEALANRYGELEDNANKCTTEEYSYMLERLELERVELEQERLRLQDHFARKLAMIRSRRDEAYKQSYSQQQAAFTQLANQTNHGLTLSQLSPGGPKSPPKAKTAKIDKQKSIAQAEKGWIQLSSAKMETHNFHLRNKQAAGSALFQAKITPHKLKLKESMRAAAPSSPVHTQAPVSPSATATGLGDSLEGDKELSLALQQSYMRPKRQMTTEEIVQDSFQRFKTRLQIASNKWQAARNKTWPRLLDFISSPTKPLTMEHISLPEKSFVVVVMTKEEQQYAHALREAELPCMHYEDERRRMVLAEQSLEQSLHDPAPFHFPQYMQQQQMQHGHAQGQGQQEAHSHSPNAHTGHLGTSQWRSSSPVTSEHQSMHVQPQPSAVEIDAAYRWLSASRPLIICDRSPKEYVFCLVDYGNGADRRGFSQYALEWREFSSYSSQEVLAGCVLLGDITAVQPHHMDAEVLMLSMEESTRALKNAKGRTAITLRCGSQNDCIKYCNAISILLAVR